MRILAGLVAAALLAGCLSWPGEDEAPSPIAGGPRTSYLHSAMTLADAAEANASAVRTGAFFQKWASGDDYPTWVADALGADARVTAAIVTLFVRVTGPVVESGRFPDIMVYAGSGDAWMGYGERRDVRAFEPDRLYELEVEIALPEGGLWLPAAEGFGLKVVPVMLQQEERADVEILVGGDRASRVAWTVEPLALPPARPTPGSATGEVAGTVYAGPAAPPSTSHRTGVAVPEGSAYLVAWMNTSESVGVPDLDLSVVGPRGDVLATAGTPTPREAVRLAASNLQGGGEYGLVVTTAGAPRASFQLEWIVGAP